MTLKVEFTFTL